MDRLFKKDFTMLVIAQITSVLGSAILRFALNLYILDITGRVDIFATIFAITEIPGIILAPFGGAIADRFSRKKIIVLLDFISSALIILVFILLNMELASIPIIAVFLVFFAIKGNMYHPTVMASVPTLVSAEKLVQANGIVNGVRSVSFMAGPILGGMLYGFIGVYNLLAITALIIFLSAVMEIFIQIPFTKREMQGKLVATFIADLKSTFIYISKDNPTVMKLLLISAPLNMLITPFYIIGTPYILRVVLQSSEALFGIGMAAAPFAGIIGAFTIGIFSKRMILPHLYKYAALYTIMVLPMAFAVTPIMLSMGLWPPFVTYSVFGGLFVFVGTVMSIFVVSIIQKETPDESMGKVMALVGTISQSIQPLGLLIYGFVFEQFNTAVFIPIMLACFFGAVLSVATKRIIR